MENKFQAAKNYNFIQDLTIDSYIDSKDQVNHWCVAQVCDIDDEKGVIKIHFEGWGTRYDELVKKNSQKLAPFRRHTTGYTGQKKLAMRDFKINLPYLQTIKTQISETILYGFKNFESPIQLLQFIRGELYFYVDSLISLVAPTSFEDLPGIFEFMQNIFRLIFKWMEVFPNYLKSFYESQQHPQLYLVDLDAAIANCGNELFDILEKCFGGCQRCAKFFAKFSSEYIFEGDKPFASKDQKKSNGLRMSFLNSFGNLRGFDLILDFINFEYQDSKGKTVKGCPFVLILKLLRPFTYILDQTDKQFSSKFSDQIQKALMTRLDNLSENEIKESDKDILREIIEVLRFYIQQIDPQNSDQIVELYELKIAQKYLRCPFFEKRVRGINELKEIYFKVLNSHSRNRNEQQEYTKWLTPDKYSQWILQEGIIEFIFIENPHVELIKRSYEILRLLAFDERYFSAEIMDMLWSCCREKHEDIIRATLDLIQDLVILLPLDRIQQFFSKLSTIKESEYDEKMVTFLRNYTLNTMRNIRNVRKGDQRQGMVNNLLRGKKEVKVDESKYIDLHKFWLVFQDANKVSQKVKETALSSLIDILIDFNEKEMKDHFILLSLENIKKSDTFQISLIFLRRILNTFPLESNQRLKTSNQPTSVNVVLSEIFNKYDLFDLIINNTSEYLKQAQAQILISNKKLGQGEKIYQQIFQGNITHEEFVKNIINFVDFVLVNSKVTLKYGHVEKMFSLFVNRAISEYETNLFFQLITKENENSRSNQRKFLLDDKVRQEVFSNIFCNNKVFNSEKINYEGFLCFKRLFLIVNEEEKTLEVQREDRILVLNLNLLQGMETLWSIAIQCNNQRVKDICKDFLVDLYLKIKTKSSLQKKTINELFPQKCFAQFKNASERPDFQLNCLRLIKTFISRFDGEHILEEDLTQFDQKEIKQIQVTLTPDKITQMIQIHPSQKFWQLKRRMANAYKLRLSEFFIKTKQGPLEDSIYDEQLKDYKIDTLHIHRVPMEEMERDFPRYIICYNNEFLNQFLDLLRSGQEDCKREVQNLLEILPISPNAKFFIRDKIIGLTTPNIKELNKIFYWNPAELSRTSYSLISLEDLLIPRKETNNQEQLQLEIQTKLEFCTKFIQSGGFQFLSEAFTQLEKKDLEKDILKTKVLTILLKLITHLFQQQKQIPILRQQIDSQVIQSLVSEALILFQNLITTIQMQQISGISQNEMGEVRSLTKDVQILQNTLNFINKALLSYPKEIGTLYEFPQISEIIRIALIDIEVEVVQRLTSSIIQDLCVKLENSQLIEIKPSFFFMKIFIDECLNFALDQQNCVKTRNFFNLMNQVFNDTEVHSHVSKIRPVLNLTKDLANMIFSRDIIEISARDEDTVLQGIFALLKNMFHKYPELRDIYQDKNKLLQYIIHDCLFHKETRGHVIAKQKALPPKCKNNSTRDKSLELLNELCYKNTEGIQILIRYLKNYISETFWRTPRKNDWGISVHQQERSLTGFVGLKNIGCICYMNSIMQQLFMIPSFRKSMLEVEDQSLALDNQNNDENVLYQLKMIFGGLMEIEKQYYNPKKFCGAFKDIDGSPIDPFVQKDVDEFFNMLMDRIENLIKGKKEERVIKNLFQGVFANEFICKGCPHYSEREEPFLAINLQVKNKHSIKESLDSFVEGEMLEGDNAYYCEKCEKKVNTLKRCCIKRMPNVLFMVLKRFEFNYDTMTKFKINDYCEFPMSINMSEYGQEYLAKKDLLKEMEDKNLTKEDLNEDQRATLERNIPSKYYDYTLKGAVIHIGTAEQGHYISIIQDRENPNGKWYEFNDHLVREFDPQDIPNDAFGGDDDTFVNNFNMQNIQGGIQNEQMMNAMKQLKAKIKNAYVLIYEREEILDMEKVNEIIDDPQVNTNKQEMLYRFDNCRFPKMNLSQIQIPLQIHDTILEKNKKFWLSKFIFNRTYIDSVYNIFQHIVIEEDNNYELARQNDLQSLSGTQLEIYKFFTTFFLTTVIRAKERKAVPNYMKIIRESLTKSLSLSLWLLETFSNQDLIKEFLIDCPIPDMKRFVAGLLKTAMKKVYQYEEPHLALYIQKQESNIIDFINETQMNHIKHHRCIDLRSSTNVEYSINSSMLCQNMNLFVMSHHTKEIPVLIMFFNSFIHLNISPHYFRNSLLCGQFYQVFSRFAELGEQARLYMLRNRSVGRLLDLFMNGEMHKNQLQVHDKFRNITLSLIPLFKIDKQLYLESKLEKNDVFLSVAERKKNLMTATAPFQFLVNTVSILSRSCRFVISQTQNPYALDQLNYKLDDDELCMVIDHKNNQWWQNSNTRLSRNVIAEMFAHISFDNKEFSMQVLSTILDGLTRVPFESMKYFERALVKMLMIKDQYQPDRTKKALQCILDLMKTSTQYYKDVDSLIDIVHKLAQRSQLVVDLMTKQSQIYRFIEQWSKENPHTPLNQTKTRVFRQGIINWNNSKFNGQFNQNFIDKVSQYTKDRLLKIQSLINKETTPNENLYDSDDDMYSHEFQEKERVDFCDQQDNWYTGYIEISLDEMVRCHCDVQQNQKVNPMWIETEGDKIAPPNTYSTSEKKRLHQFYIRHLNNLISSSMGN